MTLLIAGHDPNWKPRTPVLEHPRWVEARAYSGVCPFCGKAWTGRARAQVTCSKACGQLLARQTDRAWDRVRKARRAGQVQP